MRTELTGMLTESQGLARNHIHIYIREIVAHFFHKPLTYHIIYPPVYHVCSDSVNIIVIELFSKIKYKTTYVLANCMEISSKSSPTVAISSVFHSPFGLETSTKLIELSRLTIFSV